MGIWGVDPPTNTHMHTRILSTHTNTQRFSFLTKAPFWLCSAEPFGLFSTAAAVSCVLLCLYLCVRVYLCVCVLLLLFFGKSLVIITSQPAVCRATRQARTFLSFSTFRLPKGGARCCSAAPLLSQLFWAPSTAAEQFWGLTLTRLRHTRARTLKVGVEVRPTTRTRHLDEYCLLSLGFGV